MINIKTGKDKKVIERGGQGYVQEFNELKEFCLERGIDLRNIDEPINNKNKKEFKRNIINTTINKFKLSVHWLPEHNLKGHFESTLEYQERYINETNLGYSNEYSPYTGFKFSLLTTLKTWFNEYIDPGNYNLFFKMSYPWYIDIDYANKVYTFKDNNLICMEKDSHKELFRKQISKYNIIDIKKSPLNNGILVLIKLGRLNNKQIDDIPGNRTTSLRLVDEKCETLWLAKRIFNLEVYFRMNISGNMVVATSFSNRVWLDPSNGNIHSDEPNK